MSAQPVFVSHASADDAVVAKLRASLHALGVAVWADSQYLSGGAPLEAEIFPAIETERGSEAVVGEWWPGKMHGGSGGQEVRGPLFCSSIAGIGGPPVCAHHSSYPADQAGRQRLADELTANGFKPTQAKQSFDRDKINKMVEAMRDGSFDWSKASLQPVILGPNGEVMGGHHRVIAAHLAGIDLTTVPGPRPQVQSLPMNYRPVGDWIDALPDVS